MSGARGSKKSIWDTRFGKHKKALAFDECLKLAGWAIDDWITVHPNGPDNLGRHVELDGEGRIINGMGGVHNGKKLSEIGIKSAFPKEYHGEETNPDNIDNPHFVNRVEGYHQEYLENQKAQENKNEPQVEKPQLAANRKQAFSQIAQYATDMKNQRVSMGLRPNLQELEKTGTPEQVAEAKRQFAIDSAKDRYPLAKEYLETYIKPNIPGDVTQTLSKDDEINRVGRADYKDGACMSILSAYVAVDQLHKDALDRGNIYKVPRNQDGTLRGRNGDAVRMVATMAPGLIMEAGGNVQYFTEKDKDPAELCFSVLDTMEVGKEYAFAAQAGNRSGHIAVTRKIEENGNTRYQYLELQQRTRAEYERDAEIGRSLAERTGDPRYKQPERNEYFYERHASGWKDLNAERLMHRFNLEYDQFGTKDYPSRTDETVMAGIIETGQLANSKEFQDLLPYINGKPAAKKSK